MDFVFSLNDLGYLRLLLLLFDTLCLRTCVCVCACGTFCKVLFELKVLIFSAAKRKANVREFHTVRDNSCAVYISEHCSSVLVCSTWMHQKYPTSFIMSIILFLETLPFFRSGCELCCLPLKRLVTLTTVLRYCAACDFP